MPKLPDFENLGQRLNPSPGNLAPSADESAATLYAGIAGVADMVGNLAQNQLAYEDKLNSARAKNNFLAWNEQFKNTLNSDQDYKNYVTKYDEHMTQAKDTSLSLIDNHYDRKLMEVEFNEMANLEREKVKAFAWQKEVDSTRAEGLQMAHDNREMMLNTLDEDTRIELIKNMQDWISGAQEYGIYDATQAEKFRQSVALDWAKAAIETEDPKVQVQLLENSKLAEMIPADTREIMKRRAMAASKVLEKRTQNQAVNAVKAYDRQIATLVQASPEQITAWGEIVKNTPQQPAFDRLKAFERQVQKIAQKPAFEQQAFIDQKEKELKFDTGASQGEIESFNKLKASIKDNINRMRLDSLNYLEQRRDAEFTPIDFSTLSDDNAFTQFVSNEFFNRYTEMQFMQEEEKVPIKMVLLKPQEAQQLTAMLDRSTPQVQLGIFKWLRNQVSDTLQYQAIMSQIAKGSSAKYYSGLLGSYADDYSRTYLTPATKEEINDTAKLILDGEVLMKNTAGDKEPLKFNLPTNRQLIEKLNPILGNLYENRLQDLQNVLPVLKSYLLGQLNANPKEDLEDSDLLNLAVKNVIGEVVENRQSGHKIALPLGMQRDDFNKLINDQINRLKVMPGITADERYDLIDAINDAYLRNFGNDTYLFVQQDGNPVVFHGQYLMVGPGVQ